MHEIAFIGPSNVTDAMLKLVEDSYNIKTGPLLVNPEPADSAFAQPLEPLMFEYKLAELVGNDLRTAMSPLDKKIAKSNQQVAAYALCSCGSGKKRKFCECRKKKNRDNKRRSLGIL